VKLSIAQQRALYSPVSRRADVRNIHHHQYKDVHGRVVSVTVYIARYDSIMFGRPVWECRVSLGNGKAFYRLTNDRLFDAYAGAVLTLMGVGEDVEYINVSSDQTVLCLRVTVTDAERELVRNIAGEPDVYAFDLPPEREQPRPVEHRTRHEWMDKARGTVFEQTEVTDPQKQIIKGPGAA